MASTSIGAMEVPIVVTRCHIFCCQGMLRKLPKGTAECSDFGREDLRTQDLKGRHWEAFPKFFSFQKIITLYSLASHLLNYFLLCYDLARYFPCHSHVTDIFQALFFFRRWMLQQERRPSWRPSRPVWHTATVERFRAVKLNPKG